MELDLTSMMTNLALANEPWPIYAGLRDHAPAVSAPFSRSRSGKVVILSRYEDVHRALHSPASFQVKGANEIGQKRPVIPLDIDPPEHGKYRKLLDPLFSPRAVHALADETRAIAKGTAGRSRRRRFRGFPPGVHRPLPVAGLPAPGGLSPR
jgi:cytochrome P450